MGWQANVTLPYAIAYDAAYKSFQDTVKAQTDADKARAELFITAASIVTGSVLMATVASTSLRALAGKLALDAVCNQNMNRTFDLMAVAASSQTFMFAVDKVIDVTKDKLKDQLKETVTDLTNTTSHMVVSTPLGQHLQLELFLLNHKRACYKSADIVEAAAVSDGLKELAFQALYKAPMVKPPRASLDANRLALKIELCFYMSVILDSDELDQFDSRTLLGGGLGPPPKISPITQMPSNPSYPKTTTPKMSGFTQGPWQAVTYNRPGGKIRAQVDKLHQALFGEKFYKNEDWFGDVKPEDMSKELQRAEGVLNRLAQETRPLGYSDNKS